MYYNGVLHNKFRKVDVEVRVHPRVNTTHPEIEDEDVVAAFLNTLRSVPRIGTSIPPQWVGVGMDGKGRLLQYVAADEGTDHWLIFHAMPATTKILREVGLRR